MTRSTSIHAACPAHLGAGTPEDPRHVVEAWGALPTQAGPRAVLLRRVPAAGGFWQFVSGHVEPGDRTYLDAVFRELREETGLPRAGVQVHDLDETATFQGPVSGLWFRKWTVGLLLPAGTEIGAVRLSGEHDAVRVLPFRAAGSLLRFEGQRALLARFAARVGVG